MWYSFMVGIDKWNNKAIYYGSQGKRKLKDLRFGICELRFKKLKNKKSGKSKLE